MRHFHHRHAAAVPVEQFRLRLQQDIFRQYCRARAEVVNGHYIFPGKGEEKRAKGENRLFLFYPSLFPLIPSRCYSSSSGSAMRLKPASFSPFSTFISVTPCVVRPISRISLTRVRINTPLVPISMISSSTLTSVAATTLPLRAEVLIAIMPCVPRPWRVYSTIGLRLPKPFSVAVSTLCCSFSATSNEITCCLAASFMPRTPRDARPVARTSFSSKRTALPPFENNITSCLPSVTATPIR